VRCPVGIDRRDVCERTGRLKLSHGRRDRHHEAQVYVPHALSLPPYRFETFEHPGMADGPFWHGSIVDYGHRIPEPDRSMSPRGSRVEPKPGADRYDLTSLRGRLAGNERPEAIDVETELRRAMQPKLARVDTEAPTKRRARRRRRAEVVRIPEAKPQANRTPSDARRAPGRRAWRRRAAIMLVAVAALSLVAAYAQVRIHRQAKTGTVVLAVDVSRSMDATDVAPDRLAAAVTAARAFLERLPARFRVGLVTFATRTSTVVPPTDERARLLAALSSLTTPTETGTVIGDGLSAAVAAIEDDRSRNGDRPAAIVLLTDGRDSGSATTPAASASEAADLGIPVYTVAITGGTSVPQPSSPTDLLDRIAATTGGRTFTTSSAGQLTQVYSTLGSRLSYELAIGSRAGAFVGLAVALTLLATALVLLGQRDPYDALAPRR